MLELKSAHVQIYEEDHDYLKMLSTTHGDFSHIFRAIINEWVLENKKKTQSTKSKAGKKNVPHKNKSHKSKQ